jgi:hypothetical protein
MGKYAEELQTTRLSLKYQAKIEIMEQIESLSSHD